MCFVLGGMPGVFFCRCEVFVFSLETVDFDLFGARRPLWTACNPMIEMYPKTIFSALAFTVAAVAPVKAEYYRFSGTGGASVDGSDILYYETRYPVWPESTYNARWYINPAGPSSSTSFYSGPAYGPNPPTGAQTLKYIQTF